MTSPIAFAETFDDQSILLPFQRKWCDDESPLKVGEKARQIGWTWSTAAEQALIAAKSKGAGGKDCFYQTYKKEKTKKYIRQCAWWAELYRDALGMSVEFSDIQTHVLDPDDDILTYSIEFDSGFRIEALSSNPSNIRSESGGYLVIDEAAFHNDLGELIKAGAAYKMWGGRMAIMSTHNGADSQFARLVSEIKAGRRPGTVHTCTLDDALRQGLYRRICLVNGWPYSRAREMGWRQELIAEHGDFADEELFCVPSKSGGVYFPMNLIEQAMVLDDVAIVRWTVSNSLAYTDESQRRQTVDQWLRVEILPLVQRLNSDQPHFLGQDFGRYGDLSVITIGCKDRLLKKRVCFMIELGNMPHEQQWQIIEYLIDTVPRFAGGKLDKTGNGEYVAEQAEMKCNGSEDGPKIIEGVKITDKWYSENCPRMKSDLEDGDFLLPKDLDVAQDLGMFRRVNGVPKIPHLRTIDSRGNTRHGDSGISLLMFHAAATAGLVGGSPRRVPPMGWKGHAGGVL